MSSNRAASQYVIWIYRINIDMKVLAVFVITMVVIMALGKWNVNWVLREQKHFIELYP